MRDTHPSCYRPTATDALALPAANLLYVHKDTLLVYRAHEPHGVRRGRGLLGLRLLGVRPTLLLAAEQVRDLARLRVNLRVVVEFFDPAALPVQQEPRGFYHVVSHAKVVRGHAAFHDTNMALRPLDRHSRHHD